MQRRNLLRLALVAALPATLAACGGGDPLAASSGPSAASRTASGSVAIGSANFPESELLAEMYAQVLEKTGVSVERHFNIGSREVYMRGLQDGSIDMVPEYNGALLAFLADNQAVDASDSEAVRTELERELPATLTLLQESAAQDKDSLVVTAETARNNGLRTIADLAPVSKSFVLGAGAEYSGRRQGLLGLEDVYGLTFKEFRPLDAGGPLTVSALRDGDVQIASLLSTDPVISQQGFVVLDDPKNLFGVQNVVPLITTVANTPAITSALNGLSAVLTTENLSAALGRVSLDHQDSATVARDFLTEHGLA